MGYPVKGIYPGRGLNFLDIRYNYLDESSYTLKRQSDRGASRGTELGKHMRSPLGNFFLETRRKNREPPERKCN
jgi:hypothetical protein